MVKGNEILIYLSQLFRFNPLNEVAYAERIMRKFTIEVIILRQ